MSRQTRLEVRAARAYTLKNYPAAIKHLNDLLECVGENPHTLHMLALCHERQQEQAQALEFARRALRSDGGHLESLKLLARLHFLRGEHDDARRMVARALQQPHARNDAEHRQWREWAEAYTATSQDDD